MPVLEEYCDTRVSLKILAANFKLLDRHQLQSATLQYLPKHRYVFASELLHNDSCPLV